MGAELTSLIAERTSLKISSSSVVAFALSLPGPGTGISPERTAANGLFEANRALAAAFAASRSGVACGASGAAAVVSPPSEFSASARARDWLAWAAAQSRLDARTSCTSSSLACISCRSGSQYHDQ